MTTDPNAAGHLTINGTIVVAVTGVSFHGVPLRVRPAPVQGHVVGTFRDLHVTAFGRKMMGMPAGPRPSRGYRRHVRRLKARAINHG